MPLLVAGAGRPKGRRSAGMRTRRRGADDLGFAGARPPANAQGRVLSELLDA